MAQRLVDLYARADALGGFPAKVRLAGMTGVTSTQASAVPDDPALVAKFVTALDELARELQRPQLAGVAAPAALSHGPEAKLRRFSQVIADVMGQRSVFFARPRDTFARLTEAAAHGLEVPRASIWFYDAQRTKIRCADLFERETSKHSEGAELPASTFPAYFAALTTERTIAAHDALRDPRTSEFAKPYLEPLNIGAMLDVPIWVDGKMVGVVCSEHIGGKRKWTSDDENFAYAMAGFVALAEERRARA